MWLRAEADPDFIPDVACLTAWFMERCVSIPCATIGFATEKHVSRQISSDLDVPSRPDVGFELVGGSGTLAFFVGTQRYADGQGWDSNPG